MLLDQLVYLSSNQWLWDHTRFNKYHEIDSNIMQR